MTHNQINYWNYKETNRHNVETERETNRHNVVTEGETHRHNVATEGIEIGKLQETTRHNMVTEHQGYLQITETGRHNLATEGETYRHNVADESNRYYANQIQGAAVAESQRHNVVSEALNVRDLNIRAQQQSTAQYSAETGRMDAETRRQVADVNNELTRLKTLWENTLNSYGTQLTQSQIKEINSRINQIDTQTHYAPQQNAREWANTITKSIESVTRSISNVKGILK